MENRSRLLMVSPGPGWPRVWPVQLVRRCGLAMESLSWKWE